MMIMDPVILASGTALIGFLCGIILYRGDYCMVAMLRDFFLIRDTTLLRSFVLYFLVTSLLFHVGGRTGMLPFQPPPTFAPASAATLAGGLLFGIGIVLAGGCVVGTLYKMAGGSLVNWIGFAGILAGSLLYAEIHPQVRSFSAQTTFTTSVSVAQHHPALQTLFLAVLLAPCLAAIWRWTVSGKFQVTGHARGYIQPWKTAVFLALLNVFYYFLAGYPMGITTAYAKIGAYLEQMILPDHVANLAYFQNDSISFWTGGVLVSGGAGPRIDHISYTQLTLIVGIFAGALAAAVYYREFRIHGLPPRRQGIAALTGGILLALGARIATGCNLNFLLGGLPLLAWQGFFFSGAMIAGMWIGTQILTRHVIK